MEHYVIHVTKECNCKCMYCYETDKTSRYTWSEIKALLDNIIHYNNDGEFTIEFLGGEPLMAFDLVKKSVEYLELIDGINIPMYAITTNGTILNEEILTFLSQNKKVHVGISMDGNKFMNQMRVFKLGGNTHDVVMTSIKSLLPICGDGLSVHLVTHPYTIGCLDEGIQHLYDNGVRVFGIGTVEKHPDIDQAYCSRFIIEMDKISSKIITGQYPGIYVDILNNLRPQSERHYIRDNYGKMIGETYGRTDNDVASTNIYDSYIGKANGNISIYDLRKTVYDNHQNRLNKK